MSGPYLTPLPVADPTRREFVRGSAIVAGAAMLGMVPAEARERLPWQQVPGAGFTAYGAPAVTEQAVQRALAVNAAVPGNGVSWTPLHALEGTITPSGLHFERHHNGVPQIDPAHHRLHITGAVHRPLEFDLPALLRYPRQTRQCFVECGGNSNAGWRRRPLQAAAGDLHGLASCSEWTGVPLRVLLDEAQPNSKASWVVASGADAFAHRMSLPLAKARDDCLVALYQNGERIRPEQGYPLRLVVPGWEGVLNVKWLNGLELSDLPAMTRNETARYTELQKDGSARAFTFRMAPKSVITSPSAGMRLPAPGLYEITGLAWSGMGAIAQVEVSVDGGAEWQLARLDPPVLPTCFTRFRLPWQWTGRPAVLLSRATDERGTSQPARAALLAERGRHGYYHYNAMVCWAVGPDGWLSHVYADAAVENDPLETLFMDDEWD